MDHDIVLIDHANRCTMESMAWVRSAGLRGVRSVIDELGGDADTLADRCGLPSGALDSDEMLVRDSSIATMLELAASHLNCVDFGLRVAEKQDLTLLGPIALALRNSPSIAAALECTSRYMFVHARGLSVELVPDPHSDPSVIGCRYGYPRGVDIPPQSVDMRLLFLHRTVVYLNGDCSYGLQGVDLPHSPRAPLSRYEDAFHARVVPDCRDAVLRFPRTLPEQKISAPDPVARDLALAHLREQRSPNSPVTSQTRNFIRQSLGTAPVTLAATAAMLGMSARTLQRHLSEEAGSSYGAILDDVRRKRVHTLLSTTELPMTQIASAVGLTSQATLSRYARRWWGDTPGTVRADHRAHPTTGQSNPSHTFALRCRRITVLEWAP